MARVSYNNHEMCNRQHGVFTDIRQGWVVRDRKRANNCMGRIQNTEIYKQQKIITCEENVTQN